MKVDEIKQKIDNNHQVQCGIGDFYVYILNANRWISDEPMYAVESHFGEHRYFEYETFHEAYIKFLDLKQELVDIVTRIEVI